MLPGKHHRLDVHFPVYQSDRRAEPVIPRFPVIPPLSGDSPLPGAYPRDGWRSDRRGWRPNGVVKVRRGIGSNADH